MEPRGLRSRPGRDLRLPDPMTADQAILRTTLLAGLVEAARIERRRGQRRRRALRARTRLPADRGAAARGALARRRDRRRRLRRGPGRRRGALRRAPSRARASPRDHAPAAPSGQGGRDGRRVARRAPPDAPRRRLGCVRARRRHTPRADPRPDPVRRRDHLPGGAPGHRGRRRRGRRSAGARGRRPRGGGPELREARVFDVYRGEQVGAGRKSVAIHLVVPVARPDAHRRRGRRRPRADRRRARRAASTRSSERDEPIVGMPRSRRAMSRTVSRPCRRSRARVSSPRASLCGRCAAQRLRRPRLRDLTRPTRTAPASPTSTSGPARSTVDDKRTSTTSICTGPARRRARIRTSARDVRLRPHRRRTHVQRCDVRPAKRRLVHRRAGDARDAAADQASCVRAAPARAHRHGDGDQLDAASAAGEEPRRRPGRDRRARPLGHAERPPHGRRLRTARPGSHSSADVTWKATFTAGSSPIAATRQKPKLRAGLVVVRPLAGIRAGRSSRYEHLAARRPHGALGVHVVGVGQRTQHPVTPVMPSLVETLEAAARHRRRDAVARASGQRNTKREPRPVARRVQRRARAERARSR